jgi:hypothetical protein
VTTRARHASLLWLSLAIIVLIVLTVATVPLLRPSYFMDGAEALGFTTRFGAFAAFIAAATSEEAAKAAAVGVANLRRSRFSWFWIAFIVAAAMGLIELVLRLFMYSERLGAGMVALHGVRTVSAHIALSLLCVVLARGMKNWIVPVAIVGLLHAGVNYSSLQIGQIGTAS